MDKIPIRRHLFLNQNEAYLTQIENDLCDQKYYVPDPDKVHFTYLVTQEEFIKIQDEIKYLILHVPKSNKEVLEMILGGLEISIKQLTKISNARKEANQSTTS